VNCVADLYISLDESLFIFLNVWTAEHPGCFPLILNILHSHVGDQSIITFLITLLITVVETKVSKNGEKSDDFARVRRFNKSQPSHTPRSVFHFSPSEMKRQLGDFCLHLGVRLTSNKAAPDLSQTTEYFILPRSPNELY
jgi:hypothetical protein